MNKVRSLVLRAYLAIWLAVSFSPPSIASHRDEPPEEAAIEVVFFDVSELPARIDEPKLRKTDRGMALECAIANRSDEQLLGTRLILMVIDLTGKLRNRITWTERTELARYSIKTFAFHPAITTEIRSTDRVFLGIDEVIGHETIWRAVGAEKALRAYSRGQHDLVPEVRTFVNKYDSPPGMRVIP